MEVPEERSSGDIGATPVELVEEVNPEIVVGYDLFLEAFLRSDAKENYIHFEEPVFLEEDLRWSNIVWGSTHLNVFIRKDVFQEGVYPDSSSLSS